MFERYTEEARRVLFFSRYEATERGNINIKTDDLLLGLLRQEQGTVSTLLKQLGVEPQSVREIAGRMQSDSGRPASSGDIPFSQRVKRVLAMASHEADALEHWHIGPEHLFLGLMAENETLAASIQSKYGVTLQAVREQAAKQPPVAHAKQTLTKRVFSRPLAVGYIQAIKLMVDQLSRTDRGSEEAAKLLGQIHSALDALADLK